MATAHGPAPHRPFAYFRTADLIAALERLGRPATTVEIAAEATGDPVGAGMRIAAHQQLSDARDRVRLSAGARGYGRAGLWHLRAEDDAA